MPFVRTPSPIKGILFWRWDAVDASVNNAVGDDSLTLATSSNEFQVAAPQARWGALHRTVLPDDSLASSGCLGTPFLVHTTPGAC